MKRIIIRTFFLWILLTCRVLPGASAISLIEGKAPSYAGEKLSFYAYSNMISFTREKMAECEVSDSGDFRCAIKLETTRLIFSELGIYNCYFFAEPGMIYDLHLPEKRERSDAEAMNPYFEPSQVHIMAKPAGTTGEGTMIQSAEDLNFLIRAFNDSFNPHYLKYQGDPILLITSAEHYGAVLNPDFNYVTYLDALQRDGMNYTRIFTFCQRFFIYESTDIIHFLQNIWMSDIL